MRRLILALAPLIWVCSLTASLSGQQAVAPLRSVDAATFARAFDTNWCLPAPTAKEYGKKPADIVAWFKELSQRDLRLRPGQQDSSASPYRLGDLVAALATVRGDTKRFDEELTRIAAQLPGLSKAERGYVAQLVRDQGLKKRKWEPEDNLKDDGILHLSTWELDDNSARTENWKSRKGSDTVIRSATIFFADLETWLHAENDVSTYFKHAENSFEEVSIPAESRMRSKDQAGNEVRTQIFRTRSDLPFPFSDYGADNRVRLSVRPDGLIMNEVYTPPSKDFYWLAGRDVFIPLYTNQGVFVAHLLVQEFGFDLDGVPESNSNRKEGVRSALGNKKRFAEARYRKPQEIAPQTGQLPPDGPLE